MKRWTVTLCLLLAATLTMSAAGLTIKYSQAVLGFAVVSGTNATPRAAIYWEGSRVTTADSYGNFAFIGIVPWDCVGQLTDGSQTIAVTVKTDRFSLVECRPPAPVQQTGQTASYFPHDDGDEEAGIVQPTPRFSDNSNGTITDNLTGLVWLKNAN